MRKNIRRFGCLLLVLIMALSTLTGCGSDEVDVPVIVPEKQIVEDSYEKNAEINNVMNYTIDYVTSKNSYFNDIDVVNLFDHMKIQVDGWDCITVGISTMGEIAAIIDRANANYVIEQTSAIIAERQAIIDKEYEEAKAKAEAKGKTYDKPKKEVRTDDIHFNNPYAYAVTLGNNSKAIAGEYKPTLLVDPRTYQVIYLDVYKYNIPYVRLEFARTNYLYNNTITQESDWVVNGIRAANVTAYAVPDETGAIPEYIDVDGLNKAAKQNIFMSGNIALGGEGFTWESLMTFCNALQLMENERTHGFTRSSDASFTYYTINLLTNPFEYNEEYINSERVDIPVTRLIATFDPLTQVCLNWTVDTYTSSTTISNKIHELSELVEVNVHEYQVDTNNYAGMRETIQTWIKNNALDTKTAYCAIETKKGQVAGIVDTGLTNLTIEPIIDGVTYNCLEYTANDDGTILGLFISIEDLAQAEAMDASEAEKYIRDHTIQRKIACCVLNTNNEIIGYMDIDKYKFTGDDGTLYYIADYEFTDAGYKNVCLLTEDLANQWLMLCAKTYKLNAEQSAELQQVFKSTGLLGVQIHLNMMFAEAEAAQKEQQSSEPEDKEDDELIEERLLAETTEVNTEADIAQFKICEEVVDINELSTTQLNNIGFAKEKTSFFMNANAAISR